MKYYIRHQDLRVVRVFKNREELCQEFIFLLDDETALHPVRLTDAEEKAFRLLDQPTNLSVDKLDPLFKRYHLEIVNKDVYDAYVNDLLTKAQQRAESFY